VAVQIIQALAWPVGAVLIALILWRSGILVDISRRATKLSVLQFSVELATVKKPELSDLAYLRDPLAPLRITSDRRSLLESLLVPGSMDYAVIDLGEGESWLITRLFLFCEFLVRQRGLQCLVFVDDREGVSHRLVGIADPRQVKWALAEQFPWLEVALTTSYDWVFSQSYDQVMNLPSPLTIPTLSMPPQDFGSPDGRLNVERATSVISCFASHPDIQHLGPPGPGAPWNAPPPGTEGPISLQEEWTDLGRNLWEHTSWIKGPKLARLLGSTVLREDAWLFDNPTAGDEHGLREILARSGNFVAVVNQDRCFRELIDRRLVVEKVARGRLNEG
jgi:hypothetical protein